MPRSRYKFHSVVKGERPLQLVPHKIERVSLSVSCVENKNKVLKQVASVQPRRGHSNNFFVQ